MKRLLPLPLPLLLLVVLAALPLLTLSVSAQGGAIPPPVLPCSPADQPLLGQRYPTAIEPEHPIWCYVQPAAQAPTRQHGANVWVDTFDNDGPAISHFGDRAMGYRVFDLLNARPEWFKAGYFVNVNHWMVDLVDLSPYRLSGGILVAPDQQFSFENGTLVVEVDAAAGSDGMGGANRFYEIDLSPASAPTGVTVDTLYGYGAFGGVGAIGCRMERNDRGGGFVCAMYDDSARVTGGQCPNDGRVCKDNGGRPGRVWETQGVGTAHTAASVTGGYPDWPIPGTTLRLRDVWRMCADNELDLHCRDRFRMEVTKDSIHLFVNGFPAMQIDGLWAVNPDTGADNRLPDSWFQSGVRPYFTSWINGGQHTPIRWHWDRIAVNPGTPPSAAPSFCLGQPRNTCPDPVLPTGTATVTATATVMATLVPSTASPSPTLSATLTPTPMPMPTSTPSPTPLPSPSAPAIVRCDAVRLATLADGSQRYVFAPLPLTECGG